MGNSIGKRYAREMDRVEPSLTIARGVNEVVEGVEIVDVLNALVESVNPMPVRKKLRQSSPRLYQWLSGNGTLHDFALDVATGRMRKPEHFEHKFDIPKSMRQDIVALLGS